jgi:hypothetical protein
MTEANPDHEDHEFLRRLELAARAALIEALRKVYRPGNVDGVEDRKRHTAGLNALAEYADTIDADVGNAAKKLRELATALGNLDLGIIHPTLRANTIWDRHRDRGDIWAARVQAALGIEALIRAGTSIKDVEKLLGNYNLNPLLRPNADIKSAPLGWRKTLRGHVEKRRRAFEMGRPLGDDVNAEAFANGVQVIGDFAANDGPDRCYRAGLLLLKRAEHMAEALVDRADAKSTA